jgi:hypothetical protein
MSLQQMLLGAGGAVDTKPYIDDVFSTFLYTGTGSTLSINNGVDLAGEGGLVWTKGRYSNNHQLFDTARGTGKTLYTDGNWAEWPYSTTLTAFNSNGFTLGSYSGLNGSGNDYTSWSFRKAPGFFDVVTYTGNNSSNRAISHSLGSAPGLILIKALNATKEWQVWHRDQHGKVGVLDTNAAFFSNASRFPTIPTSTNFYVGNDSALNDGSTNYVAYVFAGGESTNALARSVDFDGTGDYLSLGSSTDFEMGTGDFTVECFVKVASAGVRGIFQISGTSGGLSTSYQTSLGLGWDSSYWQVYRAGGVGGSSSFNLTLNSWYHVALVRSSGVTKLYIDGIERMSTTDTYNYQGTNLAIGGYYTTGHLMDGGISNFRVVKGTAVYTSSFRPPTAPLTNITNTKLLCCNNSSTTGSTVTPGTITANGNPTASTDSPFDDPAGFVFGENEDENVISTGSYVGNASTDGPEINLGWEPQWLLYKSAEGTDNWEIIDMMRGQFFNSSSKFLRANTSGAEFSDNPVAPLSTGFKVKNSGGSNNDNNKTYIYMAIRRPDGYVGKPRTATELLALDVSNGSSTIPCFDSGFPVDFALARRPASTESWYTTSRLTGTKYLFTNTNAAEADLSLWEYDSNVGWSRGPLNNYQSWMWKRHAGFDVVLWDGTGANKISSHSLGKTPEMIWAKARSENQSWIVYHKGLNGGTNPWSKYVTLDGTIAESNWAAWVQAPTSTQFSIISNWSANNQNYIAMLFASVDGISKVGTYTGSSQGVSLSVTTGFQPRFLMVKRIDATGNWYVFDTTLGWAAGDDHNLYLNLDVSQGTHNYGEPTSTGFTFNTVNTGANTSGGSYIYYAHA